MLIYKALSICLFFFHVMQNLFQIKYFFFVNEKLTVLIGLDLVPTFRRQHELNIFLKSIFLTVYLNIKKVFIFDKKTNY